MVALVRSNSRPSRRVVQRVLPAGGGDSVVAEEPRSNTGNLGTSQARARGDLDVAQAVGAQQDDARSPHVSRESVSLPNDFFKLAPLPRREDDSFTFAHAA
jgi:hypothetical protein